MLDEMLRCWWTVKNNLAIHYSTCFVSDCWWCSTRPWCSKPSKEKNSASAAPTLWQRTAITAVRPSGVSKKCDCQWLSGKQQTFVPPTLCWKKSSLQHPKEISFGGIPNSSSIILMPCLTTWTTFFTQWLCPCGQCGHQPVFETITWLLSSSCQGCRTGTVWNLPNPASGNYTSTHRNSASGTYTMQHTRELAGTLRNRPACLQNLPPEPTPAHTGTPHSPPEPSGTFRNFWNLPELEHTPEPSGTCLRNLHPHTGTFRNLPDRNLHHHTPNLGNLPKPSGHTSTHRNSPEPSRSFLRNLLLRPAPAHTRAYLGWRQGHWRQRIDNLAMYGSQLSTSHPETEENIGANQTENKMNIDRNISES